MKAAQVIDALRKRHPTAKGQWAFITELRCEERFIDAWAINCWRSSGFHKVAYEVKVSRSDFLSELKQPWKREPALRRSNEFFFAAPKGLIQPEELPAECGLVEVYGSGVTRVKVKAQVRQADASCDWEFVALLARQQVAPHKQRVSEAQLSSAREHARWLEEQNRRAQQDRRRAAELLAARLGDTVKVGQLWRGPHPGFRRTRNTVLVRVSGLRERTYAEYPLVELEVLDQRGHPEDLRYQPTEDLGDFLLTYTPADDAV